MSFSATKGHSQNLRPTGHLQSPHLIHTPNTLYHGAKRLNENPSVSSNYSIDNQHSLPGMIPRLPTMLSQRVVHTSRQTLVYHQLLLMLPRVGGRTDPQISPFPGPRAKRSHPLGSGDIGHDLHHQQLQYRTPAPSKPASLTRVRLPVR